ncbi:hypothetical protein [Phyllobacterium endophyticum]|uniref:Uncharacterized protein n=1 Tax=Phyllobacterium endophyticum TaxID=1149773 RepID=A0A2P7ALM7_9HYPH|nr:hypothetical protein [Phyllobacterium endophyticum]MBB3236349.1 hypothetical protein [Phyllobacterium endophyticum]PSH55111.1 hypothetical protein CU100_23795 [Phyllobacterium endophyticum]TYR39886.1 hypothetical protein FY050_19895 [Phyllobacterium endophyticum]
MTIDRIGFIVVLLASIVCVVLGVVGLVKPRIPAGKWMSTASALLALSSVYQLRITGWFDSVLETFGDADKFPFGPPSEITRQIIDNPDAPIQSWIRNTLFFNPTTGAELAVASIVAAIIAVWI